MFSQVGNQRECLVQAEVQNARAFECVNRNEKVIGVTVWSFFPGQQAHAKRNQ